MMWCVENYPVVTWQIIAVDGSG